ncbi:hypothetical protein HDF11_001332 [Tunturiibacter psychrotolerans]
MKLSGLDLQRLTDFAVLLGACSLRGVLERKEALLTALSAKVAYRVAEIPLRCSRTAQLTSKS